MTELMVFTAIITVGVLGLMGAFTGISKGLLTSRTKTVAMNLATERMESLKKTSYYRVMPTTTTLFASEPGMGSFPYDGGYYPTETLNVAGVPFTRRVYIEKVQDSGGFTYIPPTLPDTGIKRLTIYVIWQEAGTWEKVTLVGLYSNPNRQPLEGTFQGKVTSGGNNLLDARVEALQKTSWFELTDSNGDYSFMVAAGTYTLRASKAGYFTRYSNSLIMVAGSTVTENFSLTALASGTVKGTAWITDHLVISQVVGSTQNSSGQYQEYAELYNPTTWTWTMASGPTTPAIDLKYQRKGDPLVIIPLTFNTLTFAPSSYYLIANTGTVTAVGITRAADAVYQTLLDNVIKVSTEAGNDAAAIGISSTASGAWIDRIGWKAASGGGNPDFFEGSALDQGSGLDNGEQFVRKTSTAGVTAGQGAAYDSNNNNVDMSNAGPMAYPPRNNTDLEAAVSGTPASGVTVSATDGLSSPATVSATGSPPYVEFTLTKVATGTWAVLFSSGAYFIQVDTVVVTANATTHIPNSATVPSWPGSTHAVKLTSTTTSGFISGTVTDGGGAALANIAVSASGNSNNTGSTGRYFLTVSSGSHTVEANPSYSGSYDPTYVTLSSAGVAMNAGVVKSGVNFTLSRAGALKGRITTNGIDALPDVTVIAKQSGIEKGLEVSDSNGYFILDSLSTGTYTVEPQVETGESVSPSTPTAAVSLGATTWVATFTVTNALAKIKGTVKKSGQSITTGVLVVATTVTITGSPPVDNGTLRSGGVLYYAASSLSDGTYSVDVRGGMGTYNIYAWYTTWNGSVATTNRDDETVANVLAGQNYTANFTW